MRSSPAESSRARTVEMIADQLPQLCWFIELQLNGEGRDAVGHIGATAQACKILFRRHQRELLALGVRREGCDLLAREHVVVGIRPRARDLDAAGAQAAEEAL